MKLPVYLDYQATTPVDPRVVDAMLPFLREKFGNSGSNHYCGRDVVGPIAVARQQVAQLMGTNANAIVFTSGATESDNLAIKGIATAKSQSGRHIITQVTEHNAVLDSCRYLATIGFDVTFLNVDAHGKVDPKDLAAAIRRGKPGTIDRTILVSIMGANNEIGTIQPIREIGHMLKDEDIVFHVDAAQAVGKIPFDVEELHVDVAAISGHKMYAPKGIGCLYVRPGIPIDCQMHGGGQEGGLRSGTLPVPLVVALGAACQLANEEMSVENRRLRELRDQFESELRALLPNVRFNGHPEDRLPGNTNMTFSGVNGERVMSGLSQVCCSASSACHSHAAKSSHVLKAIGLTDELARSSLRLGIGRFTTKPELDFARDCIVSAVKVSAL